MGKYDQGVFKKALLQDLQKHYDVTGQGMTYNHDKLKEYGLMVKAFEEMEQEGLVEIDTDEEMGFTTYSIKMLKSEKGEDRKVC